MISPICRDHKGKIGNSYGIFRTKTCGRLTIAILVASFDMLVPFSSCSANISIRYEKNLSICRL